VPGSSPVALGIPEAPERDFVASPVGQESRRCRKTGWTIFPKEGISTRDPGFFSELPRGKTCHVQQ